MTDQPPRPHPRPGARHPRRPLAAARRALTALGALLLSLAAAAATAPAASATPAPPEPPPGPPPPPPALSGPGLPLWAVLVIVGGAITLSAATTLITLALHPTHGAPPAAGPHQSRRGAPTPPPARPATGDHTSAAIPAKDTSFVMARHAPPVPGTGAGPRPDSPRLVLSPAHPMPCAAHQRPAPADSCRSSHHRRSS